MKKILVVDDAPEINVLMQDILRPHGYEVITAVDTIVALEKIRSAPPDLILLDVMLPGEDGVEFCAKLKRSAFKAIPVIMVSVKDSRDDIQKGLKAGAGDYVTKPFDPELLVGKIKQVLGASA